MSLVMSAVFLSYRRADGSEYPYIIKQMIEAEFGVGSVFMDVAELKPGAHFPSKLRDAAENCRIMIAVMGPNWEGRRDGGAEPRIKDEEDYIRLEIAIALSRPVPVIPVLIANAAMPLKTNLPKNLTLLPELQAFQLRASSLQTDLPILRTALREHEALMDWRPPVVTVAASPEMEVERWKAAQKRDKTADYAEFLRDYPNSKFAIYAWEQLSDLETERISRIADPQARTDALAALSEAWPAWEPTGNLVSLRMTTEEELGTSIWAMIDGSTNRGHLEEFIARFARTKIVAEAHARLQFLENEAVAWTNLPEPAELGAVRDFVGWYPNGVHAHEARDLLEELDWHDAARSRDPEGLRAFKSRHPSSPFNADASRLIEALKTEQDEWQAAQQRRDVASLRTFLVRNTETRLRTEVLALIAQVEAEDAAWSAIETSSILRDFEEYLRAHPQSRHASRAQAKVVQFIKVESEAWLTARYSRDIDVLEAFLKAYPNARTTEAASELLRRWKANRSAWQKKQDASLDWLNSFLRSGDLTKDVEREARARQASLQAEADRKAEEAHAAREQAERERQTLEAAAKEKAEQERQAAEVEAQFQAAAKRFDAAGLDAALAKMKPLAASKKAGEAASLKAKWGAEQKAWDKATTAGKLEDYKSFLTSHPSGRHAAEAKAKVDATPSGFAIGCGLVVVAGLLIAGAYFIGLFGLIGGLINWFLASMSGKWIGMILFAFAGWLLAGLAITWFDDDRVFRAFLSAAATLWMVWVIVWTLIDPSPCSTPHNFTLSPTGVACSVGAIADAGGTSQPAATSDTNPSPSYAGQFWNTVNWVLAPMAGKWIGMILFAIAAVALLGISFAAADEQNVPVFVLCGTLGIWLGWTLVWTFLDSFPCTTTHNFTMLALDAACYVGAIADAPMPAK